MKKTISFTIHGSNIDCENKEVTNLADPTFKKDAVNKNYLKN